MIKLGIILALSRFFHFQVEAKITNLQNLDKNEANTFLDITNNHDRIKRSNSQWFEETFLYDDNHFRECIDEQCNLAEFVETKKNQKGKLALSSDQKTKSLEQQHKEYFDKNANMCSTHPCNGKNTQFCENHWAFRKCQCFQFSYKNKDGSFELRDLFPRRK